MNSAQIFNPLRVATGYTSATHGAFNKSCFRDWISQSQNATEKVLLWRSYQLPRQGNM